MEGAAFAEQLPINAATSEELKMDFSHASLHADLSHTRDEMKQGHLDHHAQGEDTPSSEPSSTQQTKAMGSSTDVEQPTENERLGTTLVEAKPDNPSQTQKTARNQIVTNSSRNQQAAPARQTSTAKRRPPSAVTLMAWMLRYNTAFLKACREGDKDKAELMLRKGADVNAADRGDTALTYAASYSKPGMVLWLINRGANVNLRNSLGDSPLGRASHRSNLGPYSLTNKDKVEIIMALLDHEADINPTIGFPRSPLGAAISNGDEKLVHLFLERGAYYRTLSTEVRGDLLHNAAGNGNSGIVQILLENGAAGQDPKRNLAFTMRSAIYAGHIPIMELLLGYGADVNFQYPGGSSCLSSAIRYRRHACIRILIDNGADVNFKLACKPLLWIALEMGDEETALLLIESKTDIHAKTIAGPGRTEAIHIAASSGRCPKTIKALIELGSDVNAFDNGGNTPLDRGYHFSETARILREYGAKEGSTTRGTLLHRWE